MELKRKVKGKDKRRGENGVQEEGEGKGEEERREWS